MLSGFIASSPEDAAYNNKIRPVLNSPLKLFIRYSPLDSDSQIQLLKTMDMSLDRSLRRFVNTE